MKKRVISTILTAIMMLAFVLTGCGGEDNNRKGGTGKEEKVEREQKEDFAQGDLFSGTIFDELVIGETTKTEVEALLEKRILEHENVYVQNAYHALLEKTTITDTFCEWDALYQYVLMGSGKKENYVVSDWTVEILLDDDEQYKDAVKYIQSAIDQNALSEYTPLDAVYSDDLVRGEVIYYPIEKLKINDVDCIKYIMFGKFANCEREDAKHIVVMSVGITAEGNYDNGEIIKVPTFTLEVEDSIINEAIPEILPSYPSEEESYQNNQQEEVKDYDIEGIRISEGAKYQYQIIGPDDIIIEYAGNKPDSTVGEFEGSFYCDTSTWISEIGVYLDGEYFMTKVENFVGCAEPNYTWRVSDYELYCLYIRKLEVPPTLFQVSVTYNDGTIGNLEVEEVELNRYGHSLEIDITTKGGDKARCFVEIAELWEDSEDFATPEEIEQWYKDLCAY